MDVTIVFSAQKNDKVPSFLKIEELLKLVEVHLRNFLRKHSYLKT